MSCTVRVPGVNAIMEPLPIRSDIRLLPSRSAFIPRTSAVSASSASGSDGDPPGTTPLVQGPSGALTSGLDTGSSLPQAPTLEPLVRLRGFLELFSWQRGGHLVVVGRVTKCLAPRC